VSTVLVRVITLGPLEVLGEVYASEPEHLLEQIFVHQVVCLDHLALMLFLPLELLRQDVVVHLGTP